MPNKKEEPKKTQEKKAKEHREECAATRRSAAEWWYEHDPEYAKDRGFYIEEVEAVVNKTESN